MEYGKIGLFEHNTEKVEVIVIGAGIAGLAAARDLDVRAADTMSWCSRRATGSGAALLDLARSGRAGRPWEPPRIHGFEDNPISRLAKRHGIEILRTDISSVSPARYRSVALYEEDGRRLSGQETVDVSEMMADYLDFIALKQKEGREMSLLAVEEEFAATQNFNPGQRRRLNFIARTYLEHEWAGPRSEVSLLEYDKALNFTNTIVFFRKATASLPTSWFRTLEPSLGTKLKPMDSSGALVDVLTNHGGHLFHRVFVTVPLGVLQSGKIAFNPTLPASKHEAIRETRMGVFNKIFLKFDAVFWDKDYELIGYIGSSDCGLARNRQFRQNRRLAPLAGLQRGRGRPEKRTPQRLRTRGRPDGVSAENVWERESPSRPVTWSHVEAQIPTASAPIPMSLSAPNKACAARWAYPLENRIFFAGEATSQYFPSTVHGAFLSECGARLRKKSCSPTPRKTLWKTQLRTD